MVRGELLVSNRVLVIEKILLCGGGTLSLASGSGIIIRASISLIDRIRQTRKGYHSIRY